MSVKTDLIAARALIDTPEKWGKGGRSFGNSYTAAPDGPLCAMGACNVMAYQRGENSFDRVGAVYAELAEALNAALPGKRYSAVADFNDAPATTHADVMALFDRAIEAAE